jgi:hypothetical protein
MKTLSQIIEEVGDGGRPDYDDLRYALVAVNALRGFDQRALLNLVRGKREGKKPVLAYDPEYQANESFKRAANAFAKPPKEYVGPAHDPDTEECQRSRRISKKILNKVLERRQDASVGGQDHGHPTQ